MADNGATGFQVDPAALTRHAADFPSFADRVGAIHGELTSTLATAGSCWGDDEAGRSFAASHLSPANGTLDQLGALPGRLTDVGDRFTATATGYQRADEYAQELLPGQG
jgi:hypothetical protein